MLKTIKDKTKSNLRQDVIWTFSLQIAIMLCSFIINKLLSNRLSIDDFGQYNVIKRSVQVLSFVMLAGVGIALPRYIPIYRNSTPPKSIVPLLSASLVYILGISFVVVLLCTLFSSQLESFIIGKNGNPYLMYVAVGYAFTLAMSQYVFAYYRGISDFKRFNGSQLTMQLLIILPLIMTPVLSVNTVFLSWLVIAALLTFFLMGKEIKKFIVQHGTFILDTHIKPHLITIIRYSSGRLLSDFFQFSLTAFPLIYISSFHGLQSTAYFSVGITFITMTTPLFSFMGIIMLPYASQSIAQNEFLKAKRLISKLTLLYLCTSTILIAVFYIFMRLLILLFFAKEYLTAISLSRLLIFSILPQAIYLLYRNTIDAVSFFPYNTITLGICLVLMAISFSLCNTLTQYAWSYLIISTLQGILSFITWHLAKKKVKK